MPCGWHVPWLHAVKSCNDAHPRAVGMTLIIPTMSETEPGADYRKNTAQRMALGPAVELMVTVT